MANLNPGPLNRTLLHSNDEHRAKHVYNGGIAVDKILTVRRSDRLFWEMLPGIDEQVIDAVAAAGFEGIIQVGNGKIDNALITALVERWRPETHTFHLPIGEVTVTLQDVQVLWGLRVDGNVVTGSGSSTANYINMCQNLMGFTPPPNTVLHGSIKLSCLLDEMNRPLPENPTENQINQKARVVIMHLIGGTLFVNTSGSKVGLYHLNNLENLEECAQLSWGSAVLACLYRRLCKATHFQAAGIGGPLGLLKLWVWERFEIFQPSLSNINFDFLSPYGARWNVPRSFARVTSHVLQVCRSQLTSLKTNGFNWTPYSEEVLENLPLYCTNDQNNWRYDTFILYWEVVETHQASRVLRQFGMFQPIPDPPLFDYATHCDIHRLSLQNHPNLNWANKTANFIIRWNQRLAYIQNGMQVPDFVVASPQYLAWYREHTVLFISRPNTEQRGYQSLGEDREFLLEGMSQMHNQSMQFMGMEPPPTHGYQMLQNTANQFGHYVQGDNWMPQGPTHFQENYQPNPQHIYRAARESRQENQPDPFLGSSNLYRGGSNVAYDFFNASNPYTGPAPTTETAGTSNRNVGAYDFFNTSNPYTGPTPTTEMAGPTNRDVGANPESQDVYTPFLQATTDFVSTFSSPNPYFQQQDMGQQSRSPTFNYTPISPFPDLDPFDSPAENLGDDDQEVNIARERRPRRYRRRPGCGTGGRYGDH